jgi:P4 family phage/plasmid primase-like protien
VDPRECNDLSRGEAAERYARNGWYVLPVWWVVDGVCACGDASCSNKGKHPLSALVAHGHSQATTDVTTVRDWWRQYPLANVGVSCKPSGFLALDVDQGKVPPEDWPDFVNNGDRPPLTLVQRSGNDDPAHHVLYSTKSFGPDVKIRGKVAAPGAPGVDKMLIRNNGFIVVAPSVHASGNKYRWLNSEKIADPPPVMLPRLTYTAHGETDGATGDRVAHVTSFRDLTQTAVNRAEEGESRAEVGHWLACQLRDNGCARDDAESIFLPVFYRETVELRPDAPDPRIVGRWARNAWSTPARAPLPGFDPQVRQVMAAAAVPQTPPQGLALPEPTGTTTPAVAAPETVPQPHPVPVEADQPAGQDVEHADQPPHDVVRPEAGGPADGLFEVTETLLAEAANPINATDVGNARRFVRLFTGRALYVADVEQWYLWDGVRWKPDVEKIVLKLAAEVVDDIREQAVLAADPDERTRWNAWAHQTESIGHQTALVKLAQARMSVRADVFDRDPWLLVVRNGTVDLRTGRLRESRPEELCSRQAAVTFDSDATAPKWRAHVRFVSNSDLELASYLRRAIGYTLTGLTSERAFFFLTGEGSNGKNAFIEPIMQLLGEYGKTASSSLLTGGDEQHPTIIADLLGARLVFVDETREGKRLNAERIKGLTGSKRIKARLMGKNFFEFEPQFKLWITGNGRPVVRDPSDGTWKRLNEVPARGLVGRDVQLIKDYGEVLYHEEASGILNWALEGLIDWRQTGLAKPKSVQDAIDEHRDEEDFVGQFVDECLVPTDDPAYYLPATAVYEEYGRWARAQQLRGDNFLSKIHFGRQLAKHLGRTNRVARVGNKTLRIVDQVTWSDDASIEARIATNQAVGILE